MKGKLLLTVALAAVLAVSIIACGKLKKAAEEKNKPTETTTPTPTTPTPEAGAVTKTKVGNTYTFAGKLRGVNDSNKFDIFLESKKVSVVFTWPSGAEFHCKVLGMSGDELGDYNLNKGDTVELTGGGKFSLIIYSKGGDGIWTGVYTDK